MFDHYVRSCAHTHSLFCDGKSAPEDTVKKAIELGFASLGFSGHSFINYGDGWTMDPENTAGYIAEINRLKEAYKDQLPIYLGTELDNLSMGKVDLTPYDYYIASVHMCDSEETGKCYGYDGKIEVLLEMFRDVFHSDPIAMARRYYGDLMEHVKNTKPLIVGHFNIVVKYNDQLHLVDEDDPAYKAIATEALLECAKYASCFEVNTGNIARGNSKMPYPNRWMLELLKEKNIPVMINADCHHADKLVGGYDVAEALLKEIGFKSVVVLGRNELLEEVPIH